MTVGSIVFAPSTQSSKPMAISAILALAPQFIEAGKSVYEFVAHVREQMQRTGEWSEKDEVAFLECLGAAASRPEWKPRE